MTSASRFKRPKAAVLFILIVVAAILTVIVFGGTVREFFAQDSCQDLGGCWDEIDKVCRKTEENAQALCRRSS